MSRRFPVVVGTTNISHVPRPTLKRPSATAGKSERNGSRSTFSGRCMSTSAMPQSRFVHWEIVAGTVRSCPPIDRVHHARVPVRRRKTDIDLPSNDEEFMAWLRGCTFVSISRQGFRKKKRIRQG
ncbi:hypothetical protein EI94DRAFT_1734144 [Lactarius quietus]|nr:hypothetical protein EI94DRAFT_1734144 [Lactarius quietus]